MSLPPCRSRNSWHLRRRRSKPVSYRNIVFQFERDISRVCDAEARHLRRRTAGDHSVAGHRNRIEINFRIRSRDARHENSRHEIGRSRRRRYAGNHIIGDGVRAGRAARDTDAEGGKSRRAGADHAIDTVTRNRRIRNTAISRRRRVDILNSRADP